MNTLNLKDPHFIWNANPDRLIQDSLDEGYGILTPTGALSIQTGQFTGRSPKDKFIVKDAKTQDTVWWSDVNQPFQTAHFNVLKQKMIDFINQKIDSNCKIYVRDAFAGADQAFQIRIRVITQTPWANLFAYNLFLRPTPEELVNFVPEWTILCVPDFQADPILDHTRQGNFTIIDFTEKMILIGGSAYTGEIKKSIFTVLNYILPEEKKVLSMHSSANMDDKNHTAIFFGLSGTGKTTLSSDPNRKLIGDDEHGWSDHGIFNFEGGCYAKTIDLSEEKEPQIYKAIRRGSLLENIGAFHPDESPDYHSQKITENTRVSYPLDYIDRAVIPSIGKHPDHIFFLTCDAFGVLPPLAKLTIPQALYYFISGYTAKVAGTETGITEPTTTFSACFGRAFLPLHPAKYAHLLGEKLKENPETEVWLVNTGWSGGAYGIGKRMPLAYTRALIAAVLNHALDKVSFEKLAIFNLQIPTICPNVPADILNPKNTWKDKIAYDKKAVELAKAFVKNFEQYQAGTTQDIINAAPDVR